MIGYLKGKIISIKPSQALIDVSGVGYIVNISFNTFDKISSNDNVELFIHTHVREDALSLFGFHSEIEKEMFELLISVSGIGPKLALSVLSGIQVEDLRTAISRGDLNRIVAIPGIGKKTAERLVVELKQKVEKLSEAIIGDESYSSRNEAVAALVSLGYNQKVAEKTVRDVTDILPNATLEEIIKQALKNLQ